MPKSIVDHIHKKGRSHLRTDNATGDVLWEITRTPLQGSFDSRIMVAPMYEDYVMDKHGKPVLKPSPPYLVIECSLAKAFHGQNIDNFINMIFFLCGKLNFIYPRYFS